MIDSEKKLCVGLASNAQIAVLQHIHSKTSLPKRRSFTRQGGMVLCTIFPVNRYRALQ